MNIQSKEPNFTEALQSLTGILERFRREALPLEEALALFEEGIQQVKICQRTLQSAKGKLSVLNETLDGTLEINDKAALDTKTEVKGLALPGHERFSFSLEGVEVLEEATLDKALKHLRKTFGWRLHGKTQLYSRDDASGMEALLPLANGWLSLSYWHEQSLLTLAGQLPSTEAPDERDLQEAVLEGIGLL